MLNTFEAQPLSEEEGDANNLEEEAATFNIKYLTSSKLMGLEVTGIISYKMKTIYAEHLDLVLMLWVHLFICQLKDPSFRRHILVQCLILFDYLKVVIAVVF